MKIGDHYQLVRKVGGDYEDDWYHFYGMTDGKASKSPINIGGESVDCIRKQLSEMLADLDTYGIVTNKSINRY